VALDRQSIEKKDFPIGRRGYDPDAVDAHLAAVAEEIEELRRSTRRRNESLAAAASEQVRSIVEAAESSAAEIQRQAEADALEIRAEAGSEGQATREQATTQAREYVGNVSQSTTTMMQRLDAMQNELNTLFEALRTGSNRLNADLQLLETNLDEVRDAVNPRPRFEAEAPAAARPSAPAPAAPSAGDGLGEPVWREAGEVEPAPEPVELEPAEPEQASAKLQGDALEEAQEGAAPSVPVGESSAGEPSAGSDDAEGARLVALNMAMDGKTREETEQYLAEHFKLSDRRELVEDIYASFGG
jgi:DivIVA domain-containing protein